LHFDISEIHVSAVVLKSNGARLGFIPIGVFSPLASFVTLLEVGAAFVEFNHFLSVQVMFDMSVVVNDPRRVPFAYRVYLFGSSGSMHVVVATHLLFVAKFTVPA